MPHQYVRAYRAADFKAASEITQEYSKSPKYDTEWSAWLASLGDSRLNELNRSNQKLRDMNRAIADIAFKGLLPVILLPLFAFMIYATGRWIVFGSIRRT